MKGKIAEPWFYLISLVIAGALVLPQLSAALDKTFPMQGFLSFFATGLGYMSVFFHEIGHTIAMWLMGYPAVPSFDFNHGGGLTYGLERKLFIVWCLYAMMAAGAIRLWQAGYYRFLTALGVFALFHLSIAFNDGHEIFWLYMGHGFEIMIGCFCVLRGIIGHDEYGAVERWLNMIFGAFVLFTNILMSLQLMLDDISRMAYEAQKGGHGFGDFSRIADIAGISLQTVAALSLGFLVILALITLFLGWREKQL